MRAQVIKISGARQHNLKNLHWEIPREKLVIITGLTRVSHHGLAGVVWASESWLIKNNPFSVCLCQRYESEKPLQNMHRLAVGFIVWLGGAPRTIKTA